MDVKQPLPPSPHHIHVATLLAKVAAGHDTNTLLTYTEAGTLHEMRVKLGYGVHLVTNSATTVKVEVSYSSGAMNAASALHLADEITYAAKVARAINTDTPLPALP